MLRNFARPPFDLDRLRELEPERLLYESIKPGPSGNGPPLWDLPDARAGGFDPQAPLAPKYEFDQRIAW